jgi:hypothetical protein
MKNKQWLMFGQAIAKEARGIARGCNRAATGATMYKETHTNLGHCLTTNLGHGFALVPDAVAPPNLAFGCELFECWLANWAAFIEACHRAG